MRIFNYQEVNAKQVEEGAAKLKVRWLITKDIGAKHFAMRLFEMEPGGHSPFHHHPWEHEIFILEGQGLVRSERNENQFKQGDVIFIPSNEEHQFENTGETLVKFLCLIPYQDD